MNNYQRPWLEIQYHPSDIRKGVRYFFPTRHQALIFLMILLSAAGTVVYTQVGVWGQLYFYLKKAHHRITALANAHGEVVDLKGRFVHSLKRAENALSSDLDFHMKSIHNGEVQFVKRLEDDLYKSLELITELDRSISSYLFKLDTLSTPGADQELVVDRYLNIVEEEPPIEQVRAMFVAFIVGVASTVVGSYLYRRS